MIKPRARALAAVPAAVLLLGGCYTYIPVDLGAAPADTELRVFMSRQALADVPEDIPTGGTYLTGRLVRRTRDSILIQVPVSRRVEGAGALDLRQNVFLPVSEIVDVQYRELNRGRTAMALLGGAGAAVALVLGVVDAGGTSDPGGEVEEQIRIPLFSFPIP
jgi:hypothetical protein